MPAKKSASEKVFDVAKPGSTKPDIGSKPMIVGHRSMAGDPMMREKVSTSEEKDAPSEPVEKPVSKITISPIVDATDEKDEAAPSDREAETDDGATGAADESPTKATDEAVEEVANESAEKSEKFEKTEEINVDNVEPQEKEVADDTGKNDENKADSTSDKAGSDVKKDSTKKEEQALDPTAIALERDESLKKIIESKKYHVAIKETKDHSGNRPVVMALLAVILGATGLFALIDTGMLDIGVKLPFSVFNNDTAVVAPNPITPVTPTPAAAAEEKPVSETKTADSALTIPDGYIEYINSTYGYSIWHPKTMEPFTEGEGAEDPVTEQPTVVLGVIKKETPCCSVRIESIIDVQGNNKQQLADLYKQGGVKAVAEESLRINAEDKNPNLVNKIVSELSTKKRGKVDTFEYTVSAGFSSGFFNDTVSGEVLERPAVIIFFETPKSVIRIQTEAGNAEVDKILATLSS